MKSRSWRSVEHDPSGQRYEAGGEAFHVGMWLGARAIEVLRWDMGDEPGAELRDAALHGMLENSFTFEAPPGHGINVVLEVWFADASSLERDEITGTKRGLPRRQRLRGAVAAAHASRLFAARLPESTLKRIL